MLPSRSRLPCKGLWAAIGLEGDTTFIRLDPLHIDIRVSLDYEPYCLICGTEMADDEVMDAIRSIMGANNAA